MAYITASDVTRLTTNEHIKSMALSDVEMYVAAATSILNSYKMDTTKEGFTGAVKLAAILVIDFLAFSNTGGGAFETERVGTKISYNMRDNGLQKKLREVEAILADYITSGSSRCIRRSRLVRR